MNSNDNANERRKKIRYPKNVSKLISKKKKIWKSLKKNKNAANKAKYRKCISLIKKAKHSNELTYEEKIIKSNNIGAIFKHINARLTHKCGIAPLRDLNNDLVMDNAAKAEFLNSHFVRVGTVDNGHLPELKNCCEKIVSVTCNELEIIKAINKMKSNASPGPDGLPPVLFKSVKYQLAGPLVIMFSLFFQFGCLPDEWKTAIVKPIFKKGNSSDPSNYRPISLTCVCCKLFESILKNHLLTYFIKNSFISKAQHGFLGNHSTTTNLIESLNDWTQSLEKKAIY